MGGGSKEVGICPHFHVYDCITLVLHGTQLMVGSARGLQVGGGGGGGGVRARKLRIKLIPVLFH